MKKAYVIRYLQSETDLICAVVDNDEEIVKGYEMTDLEFEVFLEKKPESVKISFETIINGVFKKLDILCEDRDVAASVLRDIREDVKTSKIMWVNYFKLNIFNEETDDVIANLYEDIVNYDECAVFLWGRGTNMVSNFHILKS